MTYTISRNDAFNSVEVVFTGKPSEAVRSALKGLRFRWHGVRKLWYGYSTEDEVRQAIDQADAGKTDVKTAAAPEANKYGVKVGDLFRASWGYEQTNVDFFQVVELVGESSVRVREVSMVLIDDKAVGPMAARRTYKTNTNGKLLPPVASSVFIKDQTKGDLKRLKSFGTDKSNVCFRLDTFAIAFLCVGETCEGYESWYY